MFKFGMNFESKVANLRLPNFGKSFYVDYDGRSTLWSRVAPWLRLTSPTPWDEILVDYQTKLKGSSLLSMPLDSTS
jgi:hypothetical protein